MCRYRKSIFQCNHSRVARYPQKACQDQLDFQAGRSTTPCLKVSTPPNTTVRVEQLCEECQSRKSKLDGKLSGVKSKMNDLKQQLSEAYGDCVKHVYESGLEGTQENDEQKKEEAEVPGKLDPEEFLRRKRDEKDAHLMMLGGSSRK